MFCAFGFYFSLAPIEADRSILGILIRNNENRENLSSIQMLNWIWQWHHCFWLWMPCKRYKNRESQFQNGRLALAFSIKSNMVCRTLDTQRSNGNTTKDFLKIFTHFKRTAGEDTEFNQRNSKALKMHSAITKRSEMSVLWMRSKSVSKQCNKIIKCTFVGMEQTTQIILFYVVVVFFFFSSVHSVVLFIDVFLPAFCCCYMQFFCHILEHNALRTLRIYMDGIYCDLNTVRNFIIDFITKFYDVMCLIHRIFLFCQTLSVKETSQRNAFRSAVVLDFSIF